MAMTPEQSVVLKKTTGSPMPVHVGDDIRDMVYGGNDQYGALKSRLGNDPNNAKLNQLRTYYSAGGRGYDPQAQADVQRGTSNGIDTLMGPIRDMYQQNGIIQNGAWAKKQDMSGNWVPIGDEGGGVMGNINGLVNPTSARDGQNPWFSKQNPEPGSYAPAPNNSFPAGSGPIAPQFRPHALPSTSYNFNPTTGLNPGLTGMHGSSINTPLAPTSLTNLYRIR